MNCGSYISGLPPSVGWSGKASGAARPLTSSGCSGGGAVSLGPGCLNYSLIFSLERRPAWRDVRRSVREILSRMAEPFGGKEYVPL